MAPSRRLCPLLPAVGLLLCGLLAGCGGAPVEIDPAGVDELVVPTPSPDADDFVAGVDNPYLPLQPGTRWGYRTSGDRPASARVSVGEGTRVVAGVRTTVVHTVVTSTSGRLVEEGYAWFAQDRAGNVWRFGEQGVTYDRRGLVTAEGRRGSWEAGVDGAQAGLAMPAAPRVGDGYAQEYAAGAAEDRAQVLSLDEVRQVGGVLYDDLLVTEITTPLEPGSVERTYYAPGTGLVLEETVSGGEELVELVSFSRG